MLCATSITLKLIYMYFKKILTPIKLVHKELVFGSHVSLENNTNENNLFITNLFIFFLSHSYWPLYSQLSRLNLTKQVITSMN